MHWLRRLVVLGIFVAALVLGWRFAKANGNPIFVDYLVGTVEAPLWAVIGGCIGIGVALGLVVMGFQAARLALTTRRYRKLAHGLEQEVHQLRNLPLGPPDAGRARAGDAALEARPRTG
jgi:uncharacterized membrane protein YciS (DUF1049 family)